jgi:hypothetical protein
MRRYTVDVDTPRYAAASRIENNSLRDNPLGLRAVSCAVAIGLGSSSSGGPASGYDRTMTAPLEKAKTELRKS